MNDDVTETALKAFHADSKVMSNSSKTRFVPEVGRMEKVTRTKLRGGAFGEGLLGMLQQAKERGGTVSNGQVSFLRASVETFNLLTGREAPEAVMREALAAEFGVPAEGIAVVVGD